jgi:hypothetical protein
MRHQMMIAILFLFRALDNPGIKKTAGCSPAVKDFKLMLTSTGQRHPGETRYRGRKVPVPVTLYLPHARPFPEMIE